MGVAPHDVAMMASSSSFSESVSEEDVPEVPHQPGADFGFPKRSFGKKATVYRAFQHCWFKKWPFLHYNESSDLVYCHTCLLMFKQKKSRTATKHL